MRNRCSKNSEWPLVFCADRRVLKGVKRIRTASLWALGILLAFDAIGPRFTLSDSRRGRQIAARAQIEQLLTALRTYHLDVGAFPTDQQGLQALRTDPGVRGWNGPYVEKEIPFDPWGASYRYSVVNGLPRILSLGGGSANGERAIASESPPR